MVERAAERLKNYIETFRAEVDAMAHAAGHEHPGQFTPHDVEVSAGPGIFKSLYEIYGYDKKQHAPGKPSRYKPADRSRPFVESRPLAPMPAAPTESA